MSRDGAWYRPQYHLAAFYPATPDGWLVNGVNKIMREEGERIGLMIKVVEESGTSWGSLLIRPDLFGCLTACSQTGARLGLGFDKLRFKFLGF